MNECDVLFELYCIVVACIVSTLIVAMKLFSYIIQKIFQVVLILFCINFWMHLSCNNRPTNN